MTVVGNTTLQPWNLEIGVSSNREIYRKDGGHFRFLISGTDRNIGEFTADTPCVEIGAAASEVMQLVGDVEVEYDVRIYDRPGNPTSPMTLSNRLGVAIKRYGDGKIESDFGTVYNVSFTSKTVYELDVRVSQENCVPIQTVGDWNDELNWDVGITPDYRDDVHFPVVSGIVEISENVTVKSLNMLGGTLVLQSSGCRDGWSVGPHSGSQE